MSAGKQPQDPGPSAKELQKNKEASTQCPICTKDLLEGLVVNECGHVFCSECKDTLTEISRANGVSRPPCPVCRRKFPNTIPGHAYTNMLEVVAQQDVTLTAVQAEAAAELAAVRAKAAAELAAVQAEAAKKLAAVQADAAKQLDAVKEHLGAVMQTLGGVTHKLATVEAKVLNDEKSAVAKVQTEKRRLEQMNEKQERAASNKAANSKQQDELEKQMLEEDKERYAASKAKKLKREEAKDKDWNPKGRR